MQCPFNLNHFSSVYSTKQIKTTSKIMPQTFKFCNFIQTSRLSAKHMFRAKLHSEIVDFPNNFELLQFQFDRWLYKAVSGLKFVLIRVM